MPHKKVVVILPHQNKKVLMQLRDKKGEIAFGGKWGFFSGTIEDGESPIQSARRELYEEIGYNTQEMFTLSTDRLSIPYKLILYSFYCPLEINVEEIHLQEGFDLGLFTFAEIYSKRLFSTRANRAFAVIDIPYVKYIMEKLKRKVDN